MPSIFGHTVAGLAISAAFTNGRPPRRVWALAVGCAVVPDLDWFTGFIKLPAGSVLSHRGVSHSLLAAALITTAAMLLGLRSQLRSPRHWLCIASATFSHGLLDACTFGGTGVAFLLPFSDARYVCVWQPIYVSPIPLSGRLLDWLLFSFGTEVVWIGIPALLVFCLSRTAAWGRRFGPKADAGPDPDRIGPAEPAGSNPHGGLRSFKAAAIRHFGLFVGFSGLFAMSSVCPLCGRPGCPTGAAGASLMGLVLASLMQWGRQLRTFLARIVQRFGRWCRGALDG